MSYYYTFARRGTETAAQLPGYPWFRRLATAQVIRDAVMPGGVIVVYDCDERDIAPVALSDDVLAFDAGPSPATTSFRTLA